MFDERRLERQSCIFCKIVRKEAPSSIIYEDDEVLAFMDIRPVSEGHALVISKEHYENIYDVPEELICKIHKVVKHIAEATREAIKPDGISIVQTVKEAEDRPLEEQFVKQICKINKRLSKEEASRLYEKFADQHEYTFSEWLKQNPLGLIGIG